MPCYDIEGNTVDCTDQGAIGVTSSSGIDPNAGLDLTNNPVANSVSSPSGPSALSSFFSFLGNVAPTITKAVTGTGTSTGLVLRVNPATGMQQYYNTATGQYVGGPVSTGIGGSLGGSSMILVVFAIIIGFLAFGGGRRHAAA